MYLILGLLEASIEPTVTRQPTVAPNPLLRLCVGCGLGACISFGAFWEHPLRQPQPDGAAIPLRFCAQAADLVHVSHLQLPRGTH